MDGLRNEGFRVGDGATRLLYSDRHAYTVVARTARTLMLRRDTATIDPAWKAEFYPGGFFGHTANGHTATYTYAPGLPGNDLKAYWSAKRGAFMAGGNRIVSGRSEFYDMNF